MSTMKLDTGSDMYEVAFVKLSPSPFPPSPPPATESCAPGIECSPPVAAPSNPPSVNKSLCLRFLQAVPLCLTAMQTYKSLHGAVHEDTLAACRALGITLEMMGAYDNAASLFQEAFDGCQELYGAGHAATVNAQHDLGMNQLKVSGHLRVVRCCI
eukprot:360331-Chlamydomonas_euryale.AAC.5